MNTSNSSHNLHTSDEARLRTKKRYRSEFRLKLYGIISIAVAVLALIILLSSVFSRASNVFYETYITLDVPLDKKRIDSKGTKDPKIIKKANFSKLIKKRLRKEFPTAKKRSQKREIYKLVADIGQYELRDQVMKNPELIGTEYKYSLLASDHVDLYMKGEMGSLQPLVNTGKASPSGTKGDIDVKLPAPTLKSGLQHIKQALVKLAKIEQNLANNQLRAVNTVSLLLKEEKDPQQKRKLENQIQGYQKKADGFIDKANALLARAKALTIGETLNDKLPSLFVKLNKGIIQVTRVTPEKITGKTIIPLESNHEVETGQWQFLLMKTPEKDRDISNQQIAWLEKLKDDNRISQSINWRFLTSPNSPEPEEAGLLGAIMGTFWTMIVCFILSFPIGVMAALYLEEFAPKNRLTSFIEININNLAAVPSIVFGLLGLSIFYGIFDVPYSSALLGGIVLSLMTLPTIIIASRAAIKAVPPSIREAALGVGASKMQTVFHHVLPLGMPGILTGSIIGMAQALGETAPLLMIGMIAFVKDLPATPMDSSASLPVQIYLWADKSELAFDMRTAGAIVVLLLFLIIMNLLAILLRKRFERRW